MAARLILNADDFGLTPGINRAIAELHAAGALTSATLMATGPAFDDAVRLAQANPTLGVGCHIVLTDGIPAAPLHLIPSLLGPDGRTFRPKLTHLLRNLLLGRISEAEIVIEATAQVHRLQHAGINVTHLDTHKHTHIFPTVTRALLQVLQSTSANSIRNPFEPTHANPQATLTRLVQIKALNTFKPTFDRITANTPHPDGTFGISATGSLTATSLQKLLSGLPPSGTYEFLCHPGHNDTKLDAITTRLRAHREVEFHALLSEIPKMLRLPSPPKLIHYGEL